MTTRARLITVSALTLALILTLIGCESSGGHTTAYVSVHHGYGYGPGWGWGYGYRPPPVIVGPPPVVIPDIPIAEPF